MQNSELIKKWKEMFDKSISDGLVDTLLKRGEELNLDPFKREISLYMNGGSPVFLVTLAGCRKTTNARQDFKGYTATNYWGQLKEYQRLGWVFDNERQEKVLKTITLTLPEGITCGIYVEGFIEPIWGVVFTEEYLPEVLNYIWQHKPITMLSKIAEVTAHRKLNPGLSDLYIWEEFDSFEQENKTEVDIDAQVKKIEELLPKINKNNPTDTAEVKKLLNALDKTKSVKKEMVYELKKRFTSQMQTDETKS